MRPIIFNPDKFGFYKIGDYRSYSLTETFEHKIRNNMNAKITWHYNDDIFSSYDWTVEPKESLSELYIARCRQIRDAYDYVVLLYSGGSDSDNILNHWLQSDCKLDEIASIWSVEGSKDKNHFQEAEIDRVVFPKIQQLKDAGIEFNFRLIDRTKIVLEYLHRFKGDWLYNQNYFITPNAASNSIFREMIPEWKNIIASGKKLCLVWGAEKPVLTRTGYDHKYYTRFSDIIDGQVQPYVQNKYYDGWYDELFYWAPEMPEIVSKQCHILKDICARTNSNSASNNMARIYLYPYWNIKTFTAGKTNLTRLLLIDNKILPVVDPNNRDFWLVGGNLHEERNEYFSGLLKHREFRKITGTYSTLHSPNYYVE